MKVASHAWSTLQAPGFAKSGQRAKCIMRGTLASYKWLSWFTALIFPAFISRFTFFTPFAQQFTR